MFLLNQMLQDYADGEGSNLHSTMFLLNPSSGSAGALTSADLHSTMFLLNPCQLCQACTLAVRIYIPLCFY